MRKKGFVFILVSVVFSAVLCMGVCAVKTVHIEHGRTPLEIAAKHTEFENFAFGGRVTGFDTEPLTASPYGAGAVSAEDIDDALNTLKMVRYLAGVPYENVKFTDELNSVAQHGAVLLASSNQFTHYPSKPQDMPDAFYSIGLRGCSASNINAGKNNISAAVLGFTADLGQNNLSNVGHRRWILKPGGQNYGIGFAKGIGSYNGYRTNMYVFDGPGASECEPDTFIAWPSPGAFPIQYFNGGKSVNEVVSTAWSINLGVGYAVPDKGSVTVKLTRKSDGKVWIFDKSTPDLGKEFMDDGKLHLAVDNDGYGIGKAIVFRPDIRTLGAIKDGEAFSVETSGIKHKDGTDAVLMYDVEFFDLENAVAEYSERLYGMDNLKAELPSFSVTMNGVTVDNTQLKYPFILCRDITYFPMTYFDSRFLGIETSYTPEEGLGVTRLDGERGEYFGEIAECTNPAEFHVSAAKGKIAVGGKGINNATEEYPLLLFRDVTYFPMTWRFCVEEFRWEYYFDAESGLVINTD